MALPLALAATPAAPPAAGEAGDGTASEGESGLPSMRGAEAAGTCSAAPHRVTLEATGRAPGASGYMTLRFAAAPYGVAVTGKGRYRYRVGVHVTSVPPAAAGTLVAWAATPELDRHLKLGAVGYEGVARGEVAWNKFLVFVTAEPSADAERWTGPVVMTGISPSGNMHTMAGHGIFQQHGIGC